MMKSPVLAESPRVRFLTGCMMYFAQGIPYGLLSIAIPAWLASEGVAAGDIASFLAVITLPWAFKIAGGPLMDRYEFLAMGRRRPWVIAMQLGLTLALLGLALVERPGEQMGLLMLLGVLINIFAASQDVAVDGMSIDLTPVEEQGRLNAFMAFGKSIGWASASAATGVMLVTFGTGVTAVACASVAGLILLAFVMIRERRGERLLPWSEGVEASVHRPAQSFRTMFGELNAVLWKPASLIVMSVMFFDGLVSGYGHALMPIAAINVFGFSTPEWSQLVAVMGLIGAVAALALGPLIDRYGARRMMLATVALVAAHAFLLAETQHLWADTLYVRTMLSIWVLMNPVVMVCMIALAMAICASRASATQFALYMSIANLGSAAGAKTYGLISEGTSYVQSYLLMGLLALFLIVTLLLYRHRAAAEPGTKTAPRYTVGMGAGEGGGVFWSGAMRCPKCRADMEVLDVDGTEIDRCFRCRGLWFDAGEAERVLRKKRAAAAIDIGEAAVGRAQNRVDRYHCPRCGGGMVRMVDPRQPHIWYEKCGSCLGTFFDAGEFSDLSEFSIADLFRRWSVPERS
ncbi:MFS transporter [Lentisalinibacter salinarum]|uniref:MFS transporter n=1 Tax=Lentisalinibacter salinarum TaxID=2992239 RepID=UPI0038705D0B